MRRSQVRPTPWARQGARECDGGEGGAWARSRGRKSLGIADLQLAGFGMRPNSCRTCGSRSQTHAQVRYLQQLASAAAAAADAALIDGHSHKDGDRFTYVAAAADAALIDGHPTDVRWESRRSGRLQPDRWTDEARTCRSGRRGPDRWTPGGECVCHEIRARSGRRGPDRWTQVCQPADRCWTASRSGRRGPDRWTLRPGGCRGARPAAAAADAALIDGHPHASRSAPERRGAVAADAALIDGHTSADPERPDGSKAAAADAALIDGHVCGHRCPQCRHAAAADAADRWTRCNRYICRYLTGVSRSGRRGPDRWTLPYARRQAKAAAAGGPDRWTRARENVGKWECGNGCGAKSRCN